MKKMLSLKRLMAAMLALLMMASLLPASAFAEPDDYEVVIKDSGGSPVQGAEIVFLVGEEKLADGESDVKGIAKFDSEVIKAADKVTVDLSGYKKLEMPITTLPESPLELAMVPATYVTVTGTVKDSHGQPVKDAEVVLSGKATYNATTDKFGSFSIENVEDDGSYTLQISKDGYKLTSQAADLTSSNEVVLSEKETVILTFSQPSVELPMGSTTSNPVTNSGGREVTYSSNDESVVTVDESGVLTPHKTGSAEITATCPENDDYLASSGSFTVSVVKGSQTLSFEKGASVTTELPSVIDDFVFVNTATSSVPGVTISYELTSGDELIEAFDTETGAITTRKTGVYSVRATATDPLSLFKPQTAEYTLTLTVPFDGSTVYYLDGEQSVAPWYTSNVTVKGSGYSFRYADEPMYSLGWKDELVVATAEDYENTPDGILNGVNLYVRRNADNAVVAVTLPKIYKDGKAPEATLKIEDKDTWNKFLYIISMGERGNEDPAVMTITAKDEHSNIQKIQYTFVEGKEPLDLDALKALEEEKWTDYSATNPPTAGELTTDGEKVDTTVDAFFTAYARVYDIAGNVTYVNSSGVILDTKAPTVTLTPSTPDYPLHGVYNKNFTVGVSAADGSDHSGILRVEYWFTAPDLVLTGSGSSEENPKVLYTAGQTEEGGVLPEDLVDTVNRNISVTAKDYNSEALVLHVKAIDRAGNEATQTVTLKVSTWNPTVQVVFEDTPAPVVPGKEIYDDARTATVVIRERTGWFNETGATNAVIAAIHATDAAGANVEDAYTIEGTWVHTDPPSGQPQDRATHTLTLHFTKDANYTLDAIQYQSKSGKKGQSDPASFVIDRLDPTAKLTVYEQSTFDKFLYIISSGLAGDGTKFNFQVTDAEDATSKIENIAYYQDNLDLATAPKNGDGSIEAKEGSSSITVKTDASGDIWFACRVHG